MILEHRTYTLPHGTTDEYLKRYETYGLPIQRRYLGRLVGCYVSEIGPMNQVLHMWAYANLAELEARRAERDMDPEWVAFRKMNVGSFVSQQTKIMVPASFSPAVGIAEAGPLKND